MSDDRRSLIGRWRGHRGTLRRDAVAGLVLGLESVPDGLAKGLLAGVSPVAGVNGYLMGTLVGAGFTSSVFMAVQGTGAMSMIIADVPGVHGSAHPSRALFTLAVLTGAVMLVAGVLRLGTMLRFVSHSVLVGFINALGVNIVLGQLANLTGYDGRGANRVARALDTVLHPFALNWSGIGVGLATVALILLFERTRLGALGIVVAIVVTSAAVAGFDLAVTTLADTGVSADSLPTPVLPELRLVPGLLIPAVSLAFVGLVQGAAISANYPNPDGSYPDSSRDFVGQGAANIASGLFQGIPVGGALSGTSLNKAGGARSRASLVIASIVMALVVVAFGWVIGYVAMPALAGLLILIGARIVSPGDLTSVWKAGPVQKAVLTVTFTLTMLIPLQYAVLAGVGLSIILDAVRQSNQLTIKQWQLDPEAGVVECDPPKELTPDSVVVLQPYGSLFFASASPFEASLPAVTPYSSNCVVIIRLRRKSDLGTTFMEVLRRYAQALADVDSKLVLVSTDERLREQLDVAGVTELVGRANIYDRTERVGAAVRAAARDAEAWVEANRQPTSGRDDA